MDFDFDLPERTILIIDDNPINLGVIADYLVDSGYGIITALTGEEGLERAGNIQPDLILLDVMMPGIDGFETCRRLKADEATKDIPVIYMTALAGADDKVKGFTTGAVDYVTKPIHQEEVLARINTHLTIHQLQQELEDKNETLERQVAKRTRDLEIALSKLQETDRAKSQFITMMSHELRTPLNAINGFSELLLMGLSGDLPEQSHNDVQLIYNNGQHLLELINDILDISQIESGHIQLEREPLRAQEVIEDVLTSSISLVKDKQLEIVTSVSDDLPLVYADRTCLKQVLLNLINNAIKFTHEGIITLKADVEDSSKIRFTVIDTGIGIPMEKLDAIFNSFQQVDMSDARLFSGTGLGLTICKQLVNLHDGEIGVQSKVGIGSEFWFTLPVAQQNTF